MLTFPSLNLLHTYTSEWIQQNQTKVKERQLQNQSKVKFKYFAQEQVPSKRYRTNSACDECRRKKKKCSGGTVCESCKKLSLNCFQGKQQQHQYENKIKNDNANDNDNTNDKNQHYNNHNNYDNKKKLNIIDKNKIENDVPSTACLLPSTSPSPTISSSPNIPIQIIHQQNGIISVSPPPPPPPSNSSLRSDANFPHYLIKKSGFNSDGQYFGGTSVFITDFNQNSDDNVSSTSSSETIPIVKTPSQYLCEQGLCEQDQYYLLKVYHSNVDTLYPMFNLDYLKQQLHSSTPSNHPTSLSTLFFLALFIRASYLVNDEYSSQQGIKYGVLSTCMTIDFNLQRDIYMSSPNPTCATVLALTIMSNHMAFNNLRHQLPYAMNYNAEACNLALSMGLHASEPSTIDSNLYQLRLRTFWLTFITDYTLKTIHGRPYAIDEGDIDLDRVNPFSKHPDNIKCTKDDDSFTEIWLNQLKCTIDLTKGIGRTVKFNYSPQRKRDQQHQFYVGYISSLDHWVCGIAKENLSIELINPNISSEKVDMDEGEEKEWKKRLQQLKKLYIYTSLMLIHKRFIDDESLKHGSRPSSLEICLHAAIEVIHLTHNMSKATLESLSTSPLTIYSMMMSLQLLQNLFTDKLKDDYMVAQAEIQFEIGYSVLQQLMICHNPQSMVYHTLCHLWKKYKEYRTGLFHHSNSNSNHHHEELLHKPNAQLSTSTQICHPQNAFIAGVNIIPGLIHPTVAHHQALTNNNIISSNNNSNHPQDYYSPSSPSTLSGNSLPFQYPLNSSNYSHSSLDNNTIDTNQKHHHHHQWKIKEYYPNKSIPTPSTSPSSSSSSLQPL